MKNFYFLLTLLITTSVAFGQNITTNGGFESWTGGVVDSWSSESGTTLIEETTTVVEGTSAINFEVTTGTQGDTDFRQSVSVTAGVVYDVSVQIYQVDNGAQARLYADGYRGYSDASLVGEWQTVSYVYTATADESVEFGLRFYDTGDFTGSAFIIADDYIVEAQSTPSLTITSPAAAERFYVDNVDVDVSVQNFNVANGTGDGHIHYTVDGGGTIMKYDTNTINLTGLSSGSHTVYMELVDNSHAPLSTPVNTTVTFFVVEIQTLPFHESFNYTPAENLGDQAPWTNNFTGDEVLINSGNLSYSTLVGTGNSITFDGTGTDPSVTYTAASSGKVYASFMMDVTDLTAMTGDGYFAVLREDGGNYAARLFINFIDTDTYNIGISGSSTLTVTTGPFNDNTTIFVVMSYDLDTDTVSAWVNPVLGGAEPAADISEATTYSGITLAEFMIRQASATQTPFITMDELQIGTSWSDVASASLAVGKNEIEGFAVYPNPVNSGQFTISSMSNSKMAVEIYDMLGKQVYAKQVQSDETIQVSNLTQGIYILRVEEEGKLATRKLIIE